MSELDQLLSQFRAHEGVEHVLLLGRDGLLVQRVGTPTSLEADTVAAMVPDIASACAALGRAADQGEFVTAVVEFAAGVAVVVSLPEDLLLALVLRPGVGFASLLREVRGGRSRLAALL